MGTDHDRATRREGWQFVGRTKCCGLWGKNYSREENRTNICHIDDTIISR